MERQLREQKYLEIYSFIYCEFAKQYLKVILPIVSTAIEKYI